MQKNYIYCLTIITFFLICCSIIYTNEKTHQKNKDFPLNIKYITHYQKETKKEIIDNPEINTNFQQNKKEEAIGKVIIKKLFLEKELYDINNKKNNVEENVTILKGSIPPENTNSIMFLAAHSGAGKKAYFKDLDQLEIGDTIELLYKGNIYLYTVKNKWETKKDGNIEVPKENRKQLILTTCSPTKENKQLIINCTIKES